MRCIGRNEVIEVVSRRVGDETNEAGHANWGFAEYKDGISILISIV